MNLFSNNSSASEVPEITDRAAVHRVPVQPMSEAGGAITVCQGVKNKTYCPLRRSCTHYNNLLGNAGLNVEKIATKEVQALFVESKTGTKCTNHKQ